MLAKVFPLFLTLMSIIFLWQSLMEYEEHEKRAWSVDFSRTDPSMLVSGSDDCKVLWHIYLQVIMPIKMIWHFLPLEIAW